MKRFLLISIAIALAGCADPTIAWYRSLTPTQRAAYDRAAAIQRDKREREYLALLKAHPELVQPPPTIVVQAAPTPMPSVQIAPVSPSNK